MKSSTEQNVVRGEFLMIFLALNSVSIYRKFQFMFLIGLVVVSVLRKATAAGQVSCERKGVTTWEFQIGNLQNCFMQQASINSEEVTIWPVDLSVGALELQRNTKIVFLPVEVANTFPNLKVYSAYYLNLRTISKANFKGLKKVVLVHLHENKIGSIPADTFEDMTSLETIHLCKNSTTFRSETISYHFYFR